MILEKGIVFAFLEEDNTQRSYFCVHPLLSEDGQQVERPVEQWPDNGTLRIVPDRREQHSFKDRMRRIGSWCIIDLTQFTGEYSKIRSNKNYQPEGAERNQYILYSDTVRPVPEGLFMEVLPGDPAASRTLSEQAVTPLFYITTGDTLYGPVRRDDPVPPQPSQPMEATCYSVTCPDGKIRTILVHRLPAQAAPVAPAAEKVTPPAEESAPAKTQNQQQKAHEEALQKRYFAKQAEEPAPQAEPSQQAEDTPAEPLRGTPIRKTQVPVAAQPPKNRLQAYVAAKGKNYRQEALAEPLPAQADLKPVSNPVTTAEEALRAAWRYPEARNQLMDAILSLEGMEGLMDQRQDAQTAECAALFVAIEKQLRTIEEERIRALVQLEQAQHSLDSFRAEAVQQLNQKHRRELQRSQQEADNAQQRLDELKAQVAELEARRSALQTGLPEQAEEGPLPLGADADAETLVARYTAAFLSDGHTISRNTALAMMAVSACRWRIGIMGPDAELIAQHTAAFARRLGWTFVELAAEEPIPPVPGLADGRVPLVCLRRQWPAELPAPVPGAVEVLLTDTMTAQVENEAFRAHPWPILQLLLPMVQANAVPMPATQPLTAPSAASLQQVLTGARLTAEDVQPVLNPLLQLVGLTADSPQWQDVCRFLLPCAERMEGGLPAACDWAVALWLLPLLTPDVDRTQVSELLQLFPISSAVWALYKDQ